MNELLDLFIGERLEAVDARSREECVVHLERGVLGRRADEGEQAALDVRENRVLLRLIEAMDLVDEEDRPLTRGAPLSRVVRRPAQVRDARRATGFRQSRELPQWLWDQQVALFATDTFAVEVLPVVPDSPFLDTAPEDAGMMHQELIAKLGVPLGELWNLTDLVADSRSTGRWDALVVVKPLHLVGGVGSPPNATALR